MFWLKTTIIYKIKEKTKKLKEKKRERESERKKDKCFIIEMNLIKLLTQYNIIKNLTF